MTFLSHLDQKNCFKKNKKKQNKSQFFLGNKDLYSILKLEYILIQSLYNILWIFLLLSRTKNLSLQVR